jgi:transposase-like protein
MTHPAGMSPARPQIRNCPICGVTMQGSKSHERAAEFDRFDCLTCHTSIVERSAETEPPRDHRE